MKMDFILNTVDTVSTKTWCELEGGWGGSCALCYSNTVELLLLLPSDPWPPCLVDTTPSCRWLQLCLLKLQLKVISFLLCSRYILCRHLTLFFCTAMLTTLLFFHSLHSLVKGVGVSIVVFCVVCSAMLDWLLTRTSVCMSEVTTFLMIALFHYQVSVLIVTAQMSSLLRHPSHWSRYLDCRASFLSCNLSAS